MSSGVRTSKNINRIWRQYNKMFPWAVQTMQRDSFKCVDCGTNQRFLIVHHIDDSRKTGTLNNDPDNLVTLCRPCHAKRHGYTISEDRGIKEMRDMGMTFEEIGKKLHITRQRVHQLYIHKLNPNVDSGGYKKLSPNVLPIDKRQ